MIWLVEDSPLDASRAVRALQEEHTIEVFTDGASVLERLTGPVLPDLLILDWVMPGVSGVDVCRYVRSSPGRMAQISVLLLTGNRRTQDLVEGLSAGANDFLSKPYEDEELRARVDSLLRQRALLERAEATEALNGRLLESTPDPLFVLDGAGVITFVNDAARTLLGGAGAVMVGRPIAEVLPTLGLDSLAEGNLRVREDFVMGDRVFSPTVRVFASTETTPSPHAPAGSAADKSTTLSLRDVTERRRADARRLDFYSMIAHDLRSPLSAIMMRTDLMLRGTHGVVPPRIVDDMRKIDGNLKSLVAMINDFLDLARLEGAAVKIARKDVDLEALIRRTMDDFAPLLEVHELSWVQEPPASPPLIVAGDAARLTQVLSNLVANAIKFTPQGGTIATQVTLADGLVEVSVKDSGRGIALEAQPTLFDRYTRVLDTAHEVAGTGLGLMIVREIVEAHGGEVGVDSSPGVGSRFWFRLPRAVG